MDVMDLFAHFSWLDLAAVILAFGSWAVLGRMIESERLSRRSVTVLMMEYRRDWMREFITRQPRIFDASILANLRQSTSFLASASMIALGGLLALIGNSEPLLGVARDFTLGAPERVVEIKLMICGVFLLQAFLKFVWANRLFGYCAVIMSAVPNDPEDPRALPRAMQAADINIRAAFNFNRGLRSLYFSLGSLAWLLGPVPFLVAVAVVAHLIWSRDFASHSRRILTDPPKPDGPAPTRDPG
ncbi:DUF599 domain-containing protein [Nioella nitratireducens]|uniref:DUF599 domain-containing protein n=1 Tax=Nioella nitratireducens TaxID=1287720 RepID=UPI0008FD3581|nr:DUF599 domain-containing protein [Nioella nitratireducens]